MLVDWLVIINLFRIVFAIIILFIGSYLDIKTRRIPNVYWIVLGLVGLSLFECQIVLEFEYEAFQYLMVTIPLGILFLSFLVCDWVIDFEGNKINESWAFLIALSGFVIIYLFFINLNHINEIIESKEIILPAVLFLLYYLFIIILLNYLDYRAYKAYKRLINKRKVKKSDKKTIVKTEISTNIRKDIEKSKKIDTKKSDKSGQGEDNQYPNADESFAWVLFFSSMGSIIIIFLLSDIIMFKPVRILGLIILILMPIIWMLFYFKYYRSSEFKDHDEEPENDENLTGNDTYIYKPPSKTLIWILFTSLILFGFYIIIYYSIIDQLSNVIAQTFIMMIWIIIFYGLYNLGIPRGGADTKALMAMVILFPIYPIISNITIHNQFFSLLNSVQVTSYLFPFVFTVLINGAVIMLFYIIILIMVNAFKSNLKFPQALLGYKLPINEVQNRFVWLMERIQDSNRKLIPFPSSDIDLKSELQKFQDRGIKEVWVTPKIPFIVPITLSLILSFIIGNIIFLMFAGFG
jgi:preflagellin peptidase FlaK